GREHAIDGRIPAEPDPDVFRAIVPDFSPDCVEPNGLSRRRTMTNDSTVRRAHFTCFHAGPKEGWAQFHLEPPQVPRPTSGKLFLQNLLGCAGLEVSLNVVPPGKGIPFLHRHQQNDEVYVVVGGRGQFLVDGESIDVGEGSVIRMGPPAARAW